MLCSHWQIVPEKSTNTLKEYCVCVLAKFGPDKFERIPGCFQGFCALLAFAAHYTLDCQGRNCKAGSPPRLYHVAELSRLQFDRNSFVIWQSWPSRGKQPVKDWLMIRGSLTSLLQPVRILGSIDQLVSTMNTVGRYTGDDYLLQRSSAFSIQNTVDSCALKLMEAMQGKISH